MARTVNRPILLEAHDHVVTAWCETHRDKKSASFPAKVLVYNSLSREYRVVVVMPEDLSAMILDIGGFSEYAHHRMKAAVLSLCEYAPVDEEDIVLDSSVS
jgi:hypothetical protein